LLTRSRKLTAIFAVIVAWGALALLVHVFEIWTEDATAAYIHPRIQLFFSSWPAGWEAIGRGSWTFAFGVVCRLALVVGPFLVIMALFESWTRDKRKAMRMVDLFQLRDRSIEDRFINEFPDEEKERYRAILDKAIKQGNEDWKLLLQKILGPEEARLIAERMERSALESQRAA
jgi:hypothetical protein